MTTETGVVTIHKKKDPYARIRNSVIQNDKISWKARGIMAYILSLPDDWKIYKSEIQKHSKDDKRASFDSGWKELVAHGYIKTKQYRDETTNQIGYKYDLFEEPEAGVDFPSTAKPTAAIPSTANPQLQSTNSVSTDKQTKQEQTPAPKGDGKKKSEVNAPDKTAYRDKVLLQEKEYAKLVEKYGVDFAEACLDKLNLSKMANKKMTYSSDYHAILNWVVDAVTKSGKRPQTAPIQQPAQNQTQVTLFNPLVDDSQSGEFRDQVNLRHMNLVSVKKLSPMEAKLKIAGEYAVAHGIELKETFEALFPYADATGLGRAISTLIQHQ